MELFTSLLSSIRIDDALSMSFIVVSHMFVCVCVVFFFFFFFSFVVNRYPSAGSNPASPNVVFGSVGQLPWCLFVRFATLLVTTLLLAGFGVTLDVSLRDWTRRFLLSFAPPQPPSVMPALQPKRRKV